MEFVQDIFHNEFALKSWFFAQAFDDLTGGAYGVLYFDKFVTGRPNPSLVALPSSSPTSGASDYCTLFTPASCTILPNPTTFK